MSPYLVLLILEFFPSGLATLPNMLDWNVTILLVNLLTKPSVFSYLKIVLCAHNCFDKKYYYNYYIIIMLVYVGDIGEISCRKIAMTGKSDIQYRSLFGWQYN